MQDPRGLAPSPFSHCPRARASEPESERSRQVSAASSRRATHSGRLQPLPLGTRQTGFTCPRPEEVTNPSPDNRRKQASFPILFPTLPVASLCFYLTLPKPQKARTQPGSWSCMVSSAVSKTVQPKHKHQPGTCFKKRRSWMTAEPKQTKWRGKKGKQLAQLGWRTGSCYTPFAS